jgi:predicted nucleic-acid-binding Zn-ribbon protein
MDVTGMDDGEVWDSMEGVVGKFGWAVWKDRSGNRMLVCDECRKDEPDTDKQILPFQGSPKCVKCKARGHDLVATMFRGFTIHMKRAGKEDHLVRRCKRCGYTWMEYPGDESSELKETRCSKAI